MDEIIVRVLRTVACSARLRILSSLIRVAETCPTDLARELGMGIDMVCAHLARLASAGLIKRRRSGAWCYYTAESPYQREAFSGKVTLWLTEALRRPTRTIKDCRVGQLRNSSSGNLEAELHDILFDATTAFANVRRIQILRRLATGEVLGVETLSKELGMSESALSRHTAKLIRRGYVDACHAGRCLEFRLADKFKTPLHERLFQIVRSEWEKK
jgi:DNA-binding transcriptional ArsR family regulator